MSVERAKGAPSRAPFFVQFQKKIKYKKSCKIDEETKMKNQCQFLCFFLSFVLIYFFDDIKIEPKKKCRQIDTGSRKEF